MHDSADLHPLPKFCQRGPKPHISWTLFLLKYPPPSRWWPSPFYMERDHLSLSFHPDSLLPCCSHVHPDTCSKFCQNGRDVGLFIEKKYLTISCCWISLIASPFLSTDEFPNTQGVDEKTGDVLVQVSEKYFRPTEACCLVPLCASVFCVYWCRAYDTCVLYLDRWIDRWMDW